MTSPAPSEPLTGQQLYHAAPLTPGTAALVVTLAIATLYLVQIIVGGFGAPGVVASVAGDAAVIALVVGLVRRRHIPLQHLGLRGAPPRFLVAALLLGISMWYVSLVIVSLLEPPGDASKLQNVVEESALAPTLLALTVFPAIAEELVFRGILLRSLAPRLGGPLAVLISAAVFGLYHLFPPQMVSTFVLGLVLGVLTLRSASIVPAMIVHALNNTVAVLLAREVLPGVVAAIEDHTVATLVGALVLVASGLALSAKGVA